MDEHSAPEAAVSWVHAPHRDQPVRVGLALSVVALAALAVGAVDPWLAVLGTVLLVGSLADGLFPTHYRLSADRAEARGLLARRTLERGACRAVRGEGIVLLEADSPHAVLRRRRSITLRSVPAEATTVLAAWPRPQGRESTTSKVPRR